MDLKYIIAQQRRRPKSPSLDLSFALDESTTSRRGQNLTFTRTSSGTFVNKNGRIVGKTTSTTSYNTANVKIDDIITFTVPSGSVVGWLDGAEVAAHDDANADNLVPSSNTTEALIRGTIIHKGETSISLRVFAKGGPNNATPAAWSISYRGPRLDYNPVTGACRGLLIEESRTNLVTRSQQINLWAGPGTTNSISTTLSPDRNTFGTLVTSSALDFGGLARSQSSYFPSAGQILTVSCWVKKGNWRYVAIVHDSIRTGGVNLPFFDLDTLQFNANGQGTYTTSIIAYPDGWYRLSITGTAIALNGPVDLWMTSSSGNARTAIGAGQTVLWWGAQLEAGSAATSYIPTTTGPATCSADVCSITGSDFTSFWNTSGGTFLFEGFLIRSTKTNLRMLSSGNTRRWLYANLPGVGTVAEALAAYDGTTTPWYFQGVRITTKFKMAISVEALECKASFNGSAISTASHNGNLLNSVTMLGLFENASGFITGVKYFPYRLPNAKLQELTTTTTQTLTYNGVPLLFNNTDIDITI
jgi:hypothetical protein